MAQVKIKKPETAWPYIKKARVFLNKQFANLAVRNTAIGVLAALAVIVLAVLWFAKIYSNPERVFWGMISDSLSTPSVTKLTTQKSQSSVIDELTQLSFTPQPIVKDVKKLSQRSNGLTTKLTLESIATPTDTYQRYSFVDRPAASGGRKVDYSKLYDLWLKNSGTGSSQNQLFNGSVIGIVLFANLPPQQREDLIKLMQKNQVYRVDFPHVLRSSGGRRMYTYDVLVNLRNYSIVAKKFIKYLKLPATQNIDPNRYPAGSTVEVAMVVDVLSRQLNKIAYAATRTSETYHAHGAIVTINPPAQTVSLPVYQKALNSITQ